MEELTGEFRKVNSIILRSIQAKSVIDKNEDRHIYIRIYIYFDLPLKSTLAFESETLQSNMIRIKHLYR